MDGFDAVILAGGAARRLGGADKPGLDVGGRTLLERVAAAARGAASTIVVGPRRPVPAARYVREDPPGAGPVPALRTGLAEVREPWFALLAADMPFLDAEAVEALRAAAARGDGAVLADDRGHPQWTAGVWRAAAVRAALAGYPGSSLRGLLAPLEPVAVPLAEAAVDCDTPEALARARARF
ncbi:molybdenum cofactor guanylyltransferase [Actinorugispora endophytica]|uniref:Molybdopterin-guanine dinucleotide biosynthesis protein A n=1 Tax=Actinorugispora endophytica TaxID=1605990 RepID=A0A4R6V4V9_9ACTN|nr:NTP transferase domain-containing protein [Actinorugispora endophytica]TDQ53327.1 molybdopterin-guanine dinucleotide biosynthesis protein A [Actinorugispora endophytica]